MIKLDERLAAVAEYVRPGSRLLDIGTDHAYLAVFCLQSGKCSNAVISDINIGPLENAAKTVELCALTSKVEAILSNGFENISENCADDIVIAGMGGILIAEILSKAQWIKSECIHIVLQPMTHAEVLRQFLCENSFRIESERAALDSHSGRAYCIISAYYDGMPIDADESYFYTGEMNASTPAERKYFSTLLSSMQKKLNGAQIQFGVESVEAKRVEKIIAKITKKLSED